MASIPAAVAPDKVFKATQCKSIIPQNLRILFPLRCSGLINFS